MLNQKESLASEIVKTITVTDEKQSKSDTVGLVENVANECKFVKNDNSWSKDDIKSVSSNKYFVGNKATVTDIKENTLEDKTLNYVESIIIDNEGKHDLTNSSDIKNNINDSNNLNSIDRTPTKHDKIPVNINPQDNINSQN